MSEVWVRIPHRGTDCRCGTATMTSCRHVRSRRAVAARCAPRTRRAATPRTPLARRQPSRRSAGGGRAYQRRGAPRGADPLAPPCPRCDDAALDGAGLRRAARAGTSATATSAAAPRRTSTCTSPTTRATPDDHRRHRWTLMRRRASRAAGPHTRPSRAAWSSTCRWKHWPCLFPQHGPGRKHERPIVLEDWQRDDRRARTRPTSCAGCSTPTAAGSRNWATPGGRRRAQALRLPALAVHATAPRTSASCAAGRSTSSTSPGGSRTGRRSASRAAPTSPGSTS